MAVSGLEKGLAWKESVVYGWPDNVGQTFFCCCLFCYISATKKPAQPCNLMSGFCGLPPF